MKRSIFSSVILTTLFFSMNTTAQTHAEMLAYLKRNITVYYVAQPNTADPEFVKMSYQVINDREDNIFFGKTSNNGMENSSQLLLALFREKADQRLVTTVYFAMQLGQKPIDFYLMNDLKGISNQFLKDYAFFSVTDPKKINYVWPGTYSVADAPDSHRAIIIGEELSVDLQHSKEIFCEMVASLELGQFGAIRKVAIEKAYIKDNFKEMVLGFPYNDTRTIADHCIADAFAFYYSKPLRDRAFLWSQESQMMLYSGPPDPDIPEENTLRYQIQKDRKEVVGFEVKNPPFDLPPGITKNFRKYDESVYLDFSPTYKYAMRNDLKLGIICYEFMERIGMKKFIEGIKYDNGKYFRATPEKKIGLIFEYLSLVMLDGKKYEDLARARTPISKGESFAIALFDLYGPNNFVSNNSSLASDFADEFEKTTGAAISPGEAENIIPYYLATWQNKIQVKAKTMKNRPGILFTQELLDVVASVMGLPVLNKEN